MIAVVIVVGSIHLLDENIRADGSLENSNMLSVVIHFLAYLSYCFSLILQSHQQRLLMFFVLLLNTFAYFGTVYLISYNSTLQLTILIPATQIILNPNSILLVVIFGLCLFIWQLYCWEYITMDRFFPIYSLFMHAKTTNNNQFLEQHLSKNKDGSFAMKFQDSEMITETIGKIFHDIGNTDSSISKMLMPEEEEMADFKLNGLLQINSKKLSDKFKIYTSSKLLKPYNLLLVCGSASLVLYLTVQYFCGIRNSREDIFLNLSFIIFTPSVYYSTYSFLSSRKTPAYNIIFQHTCLYFTIGYSITTNSDYSLLGAIIILVLSMHYNTGYLHFGFFCFASMCGCAFSLLIQALYYRSSTWNQPVFTMETSFYPIAHVLGVYLGFIVITMIQRYKVVC